MPPTPSEDHPASPSGLRVRLRQRLKACLERLRKLVPHRSEDAPPPPRWLSVARLALAIVLPVIVLFGLILMLGKWEERQRLDNEAWLLNRGGTCNMARRETRLDRAIRFAWKQWEPPLYAYYIVLPNADGEALRQLHRYYPDVQYLTLASPSLSDADATILAGFPELLSLEIEGGQVPVSSLVNLLPASRITRLGLSHLPVSAADMQVIAGLDRLESLRLVGAGLTPAHLAGLGKLTRLRFLHLGGNPLTDAAMPLLPRPPAGAVPPVLSVLELNYTGLTDAAIPHLPPTHSLDLTGNAITDAALPLLARHRDLSRLDLSKTRVTGARLDAFVSASAADRSPAPEAGPGVPEIMELRLEGLQLVPDAFRHLAAMPALAWLYLGHSNTSDRDLATLAPRSRLSFLWLNGTRVTDAGCKTLARFHGLREISLDDTRVTDAGLRSIATFAGSLSLRRTGITGSGLISLNRDTYWLSLNGCALTPAGLNTLIQDGPPHHLELANTAMGDDQLDLLQPAALPSTLQLQSTRITAQGLRRFVDRCRQAGLTDRHQLPPIYLAPGQFSPEELRRMLPHLRLRVKPAE